MTNCHQLKLQAADEKKRLTDVADTEGIFRIIQSIPSPKAEPFKYSVHPMPTLKESAFFVDIKICTIFAVREPAKPLNNAKIGGSFFSYN